MNRNLIFLPVVLQVLTTLYRARPPQAAQKVGATKAGLVN